VRELCFLNSRNISATLYYCEKRSLYCGKLNIDCEIGFAGHTVSEAIFAFNKAVDRHIENVKLGRAGGRNVVPFKR
jgi:hypothetical protein